MTVKVERVLAPNPSPFTGEGTNTWVVDSDGELVVIDPGPRIGSHHEAIVSKVADRRVSAVFVTHAHPDHAPLANPLAGELSVPVYGFRPGPDFEPDLRFSDGESIPLGRSTARVVHTPGHSDDHVCLLFGHVLFTGDHIVGGSSVMVETMVPYLESLRRLQRLDLERLYPGHGPEIDKPQEVISWYLAHRLQREQQIIDAVRIGATDISSLVRVVYRDVDPALHPLATRSVLAHLRKLDDEGVIRLEGDKVVLLDGGERTPERPSPVNNGS